MKDSRPRRAGPAARRDRGFALIAFVLLVVLVSAYVIADQLIRTNSELAKFREDRTMIALRQAKTALIAHAASEQWQLYKSLPSVPPVAYFQPGALPCPDQDNDGDADCLLPLTSSMIGRLPWKTLGVDDPRDASGERLWYALSHDFRKNQCPGVGCTTINSDTRGQLTINGSAPATQVVAIVFAPGQAIQGQVRDGANALSPSNYLELFDVSNPVNYVFTASALPSDTFNDRLLAITQADLMAAVEPVVTAKLQSRNATDIWKYLDNYLATWGSYPYAAPFANPGSADYKGAQGTYAGLLPLTADTSFVTWASPLHPSVVQISGDIDGSSNCNLSANQIQCHIDYSGGSVAQITATANGVGQSLARGHVVTDIAVTSPFSPFFSSFSVSNNLQTNGQAVIRFTLGLPSGSSSVDFTIPSPPLAGDLLNLANAVPTSNALWFLSNEWYKSVFYAVAPDWAPGGSGNCVSNAPCLTVNNLPTPNNNKRAALVLAGRALNGAVRPTGILSDYFEAPSLNLAAFSSPASTSPPTPWVFEHRVGSPSATNDRVAVVAP